MEGWIATALVALAWVGREVASNYFQLERRREEIRFTELQERRAEVIAELYSRLALTRETIRKWRSLGVELDDERRDAREELREALSDLSEYHQRHAIWLSESMSEQVEDLVAVLHTLMKSVLLDDYEPTVRLEDTGEEADPDEARELIDEISDSLEEDLEQEFRDILGSST